MDPKMLMNLAEMDPVMAALIEKEKSRQFRGIELVASEVRRALRFASCNSGFCGPLPFAFPTPLHGAPLAGRLLTRLRLLTPLSFLCNFASHFCRTSRPRP